MAAPQAAHFRRQESEKDVCGLPGNAGAAAFSLTIIGRGMALDHVTPLITVKEVDAAVPRRPATARPGQGG